jgi:hypothetical protein
VRAREVGLTVEQELSAIAPHAPLGACVMWHSLEHLADPLAALKEIAAMLSPGGTLLVAVPNAEGAQARLFGERWFHLDVPRHLYHFGERSLREVVSAAGLTLARTWHQEWEYDVMGIVQSALNAVSPTPNALFEWVTGKSDPLPLPEAVKQLALGAGVGVVAVPATAAGTLMGQGGTLILAARKEPA